VGLLAAVGVKAALMGFVPGQAWGDGWCVFQSSGILYGCSNNTNPVVADVFTGFWHRDVLSIGRRIDVDSAATIPRLRRFAPLARNDTIVQDQPSRE
jgi:hypothetical protein